MIDEQRKEIIINEFEIKKFDNKFGTKSKYFPQTNIIIIEGFLDEWRIEVKNKYAYLYHRNTRKQQNKYHYQNRSTNIHNLYDSIYKHKNWMSIVKTSNTYEGFNI